MTVVYIDLLFLLNLVANYLLLLAGGRLAGTILRRGWMALGAAVGALYACVLFLPGCQWLSAWPCRIAVGVDRSTAAAGDAAVFRRLCGSGRAGAGSRAAGQRTADHAQWSVLFPI